MDPFQHPDLASLGRRLQAQLDDVLEAEQYAAFVSARRRRTFRDQLIEWEDRESVVIAVTAAQRYKGRIASVGVDHVVIDGDATSVTVQFEQLIAVET